jgi:FlaA1/EpsC-like NDP-sugar epimerase
MNSLTRTSAFTDGELEQLLRRPLQRLLTRGDHRAFAGRRVLITGAGGSIGGELARQIARCGPERLTILDHAEFSLFTIERELRDRFPSARIDVVLADITRGRYVRQACRAFRPHVVYHAAAYKHVTMAERAICAAAAVNVVGTWHVVEAAREVGARFVFVSSDKAAAPTSVMGATKRFAEIVVLRQASPTFRPIVVRFGNVLGSSGSVLTIMRERIRQGRPVPLTDPNATRYFMAPAEAVALVMKADLRARGAETYWLDMGEPVRIGDLAERLMKLEQAAGYPRVPVEVVGLRPGEKLREELTSQGLAMCRTRSRRIWVARQPARAAAAVDAALRRLRRHAIRGDAVGTLESLASVVDDFAVSPEAAASARSQAIVLHPALQQEEAQTA